MYANMRVKIEGNEAIMAHEIVIKPDGMIEVHEDLGDEGHLVAGPVHTIAPGELPDDMRITADF